MEGDMFLAFMVALFTGVTLKTPFSSWIPVGLTGMLGWTTNQVIIRNNLPELVAALAGAMMIGLLAEILARIQRHPVTVYIVSGIIPLVPGITAYNSMLEFMNNNFDRGLHLAFRAFLIATYLSIGLALVSLLVNSVREIVYKWRRLNRSK